MFKQFQLQFIKCSCGRMVAATGAESSKNTMKRIVSLRTLTSVRKSLYSTTTTNNSSDEIVQSNPDKSPPQVQQQHSPNNNNRPFSNQSLLNRNVFPVLKSKKQQPVIMSNNILSDDVDSDETTNNDNIDELLKSNQFHNIKPYRGKSKDEQLINEYLQFLQTYQSIRKLNITIDSLAKEDKHYLAEPIFKKLLYYLTTINLPHLTSNNRNVKILRPNSYTFNVMMMSYLTVGDIPSVQSLFDSISVWEDVEKNSLPSYVNFVTLLTAYCRVGDFKTVDLLVSDFINEKIKLREGNDNQQVVSSVFTVLMKKWMDMGKLSKVEELYEKFLALGMTPSVYMGNIMINCYKMMKNYEKCIEVFENCQNAHTTDRHIICTMISVYGCMGKVEEMEKLFSTSIEKPNDFHYMLMTVGYARAGLERQAEEYFSNAGQYRDDKLLCRMMDMYSAGGNLEKLEQTFALIRKKTIEPIYIYIDAISKYGNYERVDELIKSIPPEKYTGNIWVCHLQSAVKTKFSDPDQYMERVNNIFSKKPSSISGKDNTFGIKLYKLAIGLQLSSSQKSKPTLNPPEKPISEIYKDFAEQKVRLAMDGIDEGKFQTRDSFHEQFVLNNDSIYRPDYVSPYEKFLEGYNNFKNINKNDN